MAQLAGLQPQVYYSLKNLDAPLKISPENKPVIDINLPNTDPIEINLSSFKVDTVHSVKLYYQNRLIGTLVQDDQNLKLHIIEKDIAVKLQGTPHVRNCHIKSVGDIDFSANLSSAEEMTIESKNLSINHLLLVEKNLNVTCQEKITVKAPIVAANAYLNSKNIFLNEKIAANCLECSASEQLIINNKMTAESFLLLDAKKIQNSSVLKGQIVKLTAGESLTNDGRISSTHSLKIKTDHFIDNGKISSLGKLRLNNKQAFIGKSADINSIGRCKITGGVFNHFGNLKLQGMAFFSLDNLQNGGNVELAEQSFIHVKDLNLIEQSKLGWFAEKNLSELNAYPEQTIRIIKSDNQVHIAPQSEMSLVNAKLDTDNMTIKGKAILTSSQMTSNNGLLVEQDADLSVIKSHVHSKRSLINGRLKLTNSKMLNADRMTISQAKLENSILQSRILETKENGDLTFYNAAIKSEIVDVKSKAKLTDTIIHSKFFNHTNKAEIKKSHIIAEKNFHQKTKGSIVSEQLTIATQNMAIDGTIEACDQSIFTTKNMDIQGELTLQKSAVKADLAVCDEASIIKSSDDSLFHMATLQIEGQASISDSTLQLGRFVNSGNTAITKSNLTAKDVVYSQGELFIDQVSVKSDFLNIKGRVDSKKSRIEAGDTWQEGSASLAETVLVTDFWSTEKDSKITCDQFTVKTNFIQHQGVHDYKQSTIVTKIMQQLDGSTVFSDQSQLHITELLTTEKGSFKLEGKSTLAGDKKNVAVFNGDLTVDESRLHVNELHANKFSEFNQANVRVDKLLLQGEQQITEKTEIHANEIQLKGKASLDESLMKTNELTILNGADVKAKASLIDNKNILNVYGSLTADKSKIISRDLYVYQIMKANQTIIESSGKFKGTNYATVDLTESKLQTKSLEISDTLVASESNLYADDMNFGYDSDVTLNKVKLEAKENIYFDFNNKTKGKEINIKADTLVNRGHVDVNTLKIDVEELNNDFGDIYGGEYLKIEANKVLLNTMGNIKANKTEITTAASLNLFGSMMGYDRFQLDTLANVNLFGSQRSYEVSINSLIDVNSGLVLPALPKHPINNLLGRLSSLSQVAFTNLFPKFSTSINLAYQVAPMLWNAKSNFEKIKPMIWEIGSRVYETYKKDDWRTLFSETKTKFNDVRQQWRTKDIMPALLNIKKLVVAGNNLYNSSSGIKDEWGHLSWEGLKKQFTQTSMNDLSLNLTWDGFKEQFKHVSVKDLSLAAGSVLGPSISKQTVVGYNPGILASQNAIQNDWISFNAGIETGLQSTTHNSWLMVNQGLMGGGYQATLTGKFLQNDGWISDKGKAYLDFSVISNGKSGDIEIIGGKVKAEEFNNEGLLKAKKSFIDVDNFENLHLGKFELANESILHANQFSDAGQTFAKESHLQINNDIQVKKGGLFKAEDSTAKMGKMTVDGRAEFIKNPKDNLSKDSDADEQSKESQQNPTPAVDMNKTNSSSALDLEVEQKIIVNKEGQLVLQNIAMKADGLQVLGQADLRKSDMELTNDLLLQGQSTIESSWVTAHDMQLGGTTHAELSHLEASGKVESASGDQLSLDRSYVAGQEVRFKSDLTIKQTEVNATNELVLGSKQMKAENSVFKAKDIHYASTGSYSGYLGLEADNKVTTEQGSVLQVEQKDGKNLLDITSKEGDLKGKISADNWSLSINNLPGAEELICNKGRYTGLFDVTEQLSVKTDDKIVLAQSIDRLCGLNIEGFSVDVTTDYKTAHHLHFKSTSGDIGLYSHLAAASVTANSAKDLYTTRHITGKEYVLLKAKDKYLNLGGHITGDVVSAEAGCVQNYHHRSDKLSQLDKSLRNKVGDSGVILGRETYLEATETNIENYGGVLKGTQYLQGIAKQDIVNACNVYNQRGKHGEVRSFEAAIMSGGAGLDDNHVGLYLQAGHKIKNAGSTICSHGDNYIQATKGFESTALSHTAVTSRKRETNWLGRKKEVTKTTTVVQKGSVMTTDGRNIIICEEGGIKAVATDFISTNGTQAYTKKDIELYSLKTTDKKTTKKNWLGINSSTKRESHESATPVLIVDHGITQLESAEGSIIGRGVVALGDGDFVTRAPKGSVSFSSDKLLHQIDEKRRGLSLSSPTYTSAKNALTGQMDYLNYLDPSIGKINALLHSDNALECFANGWNASLAGYNSYQALNETPFNNLLSEHSGLAQFVTPSIELSYSMSHHKLSFETTGPGAIHRRSWLIEAADTASIQGMDISIKENMKVSAKTFELKSHELQSKFTAEEKSVALSATPSGEVVQTRASYSKTTQHATTHQHQRLQVGGHLEVNADTWLIKGAAVEADTLSGKVEKLHIETVTDKQTSRSTAVDLSSSGQASFIHSQDKSAQVREVSGMNIRKGINHDDDHQFKVKHMVSEGGAITSSEGLNKFSSETITNRDVKTYHKHKSVGFSGNIKDIVESLTPQEEKQGSNQIKTVGITYNRVKMLGRQRATFFGHQGTQIEAQVVKGKMHTSSADGQAITRKNKLALTIDVPLPKFTQPRKPVLEEDNLSQQILFSPKGGEDGGPIDENPNEAATTRDQTTDVKNKDGLEEQLIDTGLTALSVAYEEVASALCKMGEKNIAKIFSGLNVGLDFTDKLLAEKKKGNENAVKTAVLQTIVDLPKTIFVPWYVNLPLNILSGATEGFTDTIDQNKEMLIRSEIWEKYGDNEMLQLHPEIFENESLQGAYGTARAIQFFAGYAEDFGAYLSEMWSYKASENEHPSTTPNYK